MRSSATDDRTQSSRPESEAQSAACVRRRSTPTELLRELQDVRLGAMYPGSQTGTDRQTRGGKLLARRRLERLLDPGTFVELGLLARQQSATNLSPYSDGVITGWGAVDGRNVFVYAQDFTVLAGTMGPVHGRKVSALLRLANEVGAPVIALNDGAGARIQNGVEALAAYGDLFYNNVRLSGVVPQVSVVLGPCAGGAVYSPAMTDFVIMARRTAQMFVTGPTVVRAATGETLTLEELGGADLHASESGLATLAFESEDECLDYTRYLLSFLPANNAELPPYAPTDDAPFRSCPELRTLLPEHSRTAYDIRSILTVIVDDGDMLELFPAWAPNIICTLARLDGHTVGFVANQPRHAAGVLNIDASEKAARFVRMCDEFNIPLVTLVDVPGFQPGRNQERQGIIRRGASLLYAFCEATVPRIQVIIRKAYGGAYIVMNSRSIGADLAFAWPTAEIAVMGVDAAIDVLHGSDLRESDDASTLRASLETHYAETFEAPYAAAQHGYVDDLIDPADTRALLVRSLNMLRSKRDHLPLRKHGNMPL